MNEGERFWSEQGPRDERSKLFRPKGRSIQQVLESMDFNLFLLSKLFTLDRGFSPKTVTVGTSPGLIYSSPQPRGIYILNPARIAGITTFGTLLPSAARNQGDSGNTQGSAIDVSSYKNIILYLDITANAGNLAVTVNAQSKDPVSLNWGTYQSDVFQGNANAVGTFIANLGTLGGDINFSVSWAVAAGAGSATFSLSYVLKDGLQGALNTSSAVFLSGTSGVSPTSGFVLLEGAGERFFIRENTDIYGVAYQNVDIKIFELS